MAIIDTGADATSYPNFVIERLDHLSVNPRPIEQPTNIIYGNGEGEAIDRMVNHGIYDILITPDHCEECLISGDQLSSSGHVLIMTHTQTIIADILMRYILRYPRDPNCKDYPVPLTILHDLSKLRMEHPLDQRAREAMQKPFQLPNMPDTTRFESANTFHHGQTPTQISHIRSGRLREMDKSLLGRVLRLHKRLGHAPEDIMCMAVDSSKGNPPWRNTGVTAKTIRSVFRWEPCLICVLAKRRKEGTLK